MTERRGGRGPRFDREEAAQLRSKEKWTLAQLAEHYGVSQQAISKGIKVYEEERLAGTTGRVKSASSWPWVIAEEHTTGDIQYRRMLALRKQREGVALPPRDAQLAQQLLAFIARRDIVITYHRKVGFAFAPRRGGDGDEVFVVRAPEWWERFGYAA